MRTSNSGGGRNPKGSVTELVEVNMNSHLAGIFRQPVIRGLLGRCPNCGEGRMFSAFLKAADVCPHCGEELYHHRADDFPAYCVILIVGHIVVTLALLTETEYAPPMWVQAAVWVPVTFGLALALLQPVKGAIVAIQWAAGMGGFERAKRIRAAAASIDFVGDAGSASRQL
jgi:uncharacterized protein (DUF983 family)